jgi:hypothetical protein
VVATPVRVREITNEEGNRLLREGSQTGPPSDPTTRGDTTRAGVARPMSASPLDMVNRSGIIRSSGRKAGARCWSPVSGSVHGQPCTNERAERVAC